MGFGLTICKILSEQLGGNILVESVLEKGSNFIFTIKDYSIVENI